MITKEQIFQLQAEQDTIIDYRGYPRTVTSLQIPSSKPNFGFATVGLRSDGQVNYYVVSEYREGIVFLDEGDVTFTQMDLSHPLTYILRFKSDDETVRCPFTFEGIKYEIPLKSFGADHIILPDGRTVDVGEWSSSECPPVPMNLKNGQEIFVAVAIGEDHSEMISPFTMRFPTAKVRKRVLIELMSEFPEMVITVRNEDGSAFFLDLQATQKQIGIIKAKWGG